MPHVLESLSRTLIALLDHLLLSLDAASFSLVDALHKGGPFMWPILFCGLWAFLSATRRLWQLRRLRPDASPGLYADIVAHLDRDDLLGAVRLCKANEHTVVGRVMLAGLQHQAQGPRQVQLAVASASMGVSADLRRRTLISLPILANVALLCGILGTIDGLIIGFEAVAHASAESGGGGRWTVSHPPEAAEPGAQFPVAEGTWGTLASEVRALPPTDLSDLVPTSRRATSSFALDADTSSFGHARRLLADGRKPDRGAVRTEEFVNALAYSWPAPPPDSAAPFALHLEAAPDPLRPELHVMTVALTGREPWARPPLNLVFLVDTSGSMGDRDRLPLAKESLLLLLGELGPEDTVALVTYSGETEVVLPPTPAGEYWTVRRAITGLDAGGGTAMGDGMRLAYETAQAGYRAGAENRVVVLSDGDANIGPRGHEEIGAYVGEQARAGVTLTTVTFGVGNSRHSDMERLADTGDGNAFTVGTLAEAREVFVDRGLGNLVTIARDVKVQVELAPEAVLAWRLAGYDNRLLSRAEYLDDTVDGGELGAGHSVVALYELILDPERPHDQLARVRLRGKLPVGAGVVDGVDPEQVHEWAGVFPGERLAADFSLASTDLRAAWLAAAFAERLRGSASMGHVDYGLLWRTGLALGRDQPEDHALQRMIVQAAGAEHRVGPVAWWCMRETRGWAGCM